MFRLKSFPENIVPELNNRFVGDLMLDLNILKLTEYTTPEIKQALACCQNFIAEKPPGQPATAEYWKAVENRLRLQRELIVRGEIDDLPVALPADRLPILTIEHSEEL